MNLHECTRTNYGYLALCIGEGKKTHENIDKRRAFTLSLATKNFVEAVDYFGIISGYKVADKFEKNGLKAITSQHIDAPIIKGNPFVIECELIEFVKTNNFSTVLAKIVNILADEKNLNEKRKN